MTSPPRARWWRRSVAAFGVVLLASLLGKAQSPGCLTLEALQRMTPCELASLYDKADVGTPMVGRLHGRLLYVNDPFMPKLRVRLSNAMWRGKAASEDGYFVNRWIGGIEAIDSHYVIGPSWVDGRPAVLMDYAPGTKILGNVHDEVREVAPGLYMGPVFERCPCPKFRGFVALQLECPTNRCCR